MKTLISATSNNSTANTTTSTNSTTANNSNNNNTNNNGGNNNNKNIAVKTEVADVATLQQQFQTPANHNTTTAAATAGGNAKRPLSLDLNKSTPAKKSRLVTPLHMDLVDLQNGKALNTPDVEKIILSSNLLQTPQPGCIFPTKVGPVTREQEDFGKGFEEVLHNLHNSKNSQAQQLNNNAAAVPTTGPLATTAIAGPGMSGGTFTYTNLENQPIAIKDEPQNPPESPPLNRIDMAAQEKIKLERKRQRNRVAASKCRKRKLERISKLEEKVKVLKGENADLGHVVKSLKDQVAVLKEEVIAHANSGCTIPTMFNGSTLLQAK